MDAALQEYYRNNPGFAQFADRQAQVSAEPEVRQAYRRWQYEQVIDALEKERLIDEGEARGRAEGEARGLAEGEARGKAWLYMESLPLYFESIKANPSLRRDIFAMGASVGVDEEMIQNEYDKWARAKIDHAMQPDPHGRASVIATLEAGKAAQDATRANKRKTQEQARDDRERQSGKNGALPN